MKLSKYTKLGLLVIGCFVILFWGINYLKGINVFNTSTTYYAKYDHVDGLVKSSVISVNGFQIGLVQDVRFSDANDGTFIVELSIEGDMKIPHGSEAVVASSDLLGTKAIKIKLAPAAKEFYADGDTIPSSIETDLVNDIGNQIAPLKDKVESLLSSLDTTLTAVNTVLNKETQIKLSKGIIDASETMANLESLTKQLDKIMLAQGDGIENIISNISVISTELKESSSDFSQIAANLSTMTDSLSEANIKATINSISSIMQKIDEGQGSAGKIVNDDELYSNLNSITANLNDLLVDFRANPSKYVNLTAVDFGKDIYVTSADVNSSDEYTFLIKLIESSNPIDTKNPMFTGLEVNEIKTKNSYVYTTGNTHNISELYPVVDRVKKDFPSAEIIAFKGDKQIKLNKALKKLIK